MSDWQPEVREVPAELEPDFNHDVYPPPATKFNTIADQLKAADHETWMALASFSTVGEPTP